MGLTVDDLRQLSPEQQFKAIADRVAAISDPTIRAAAALDVLGKSGTKLLPLMLNGAAGIDALQARARELGLTISTNTAKAAADLNDKIGLMKLVLRSVSIEVGQALLPLATSLVATIQEVARRTARWVSENQAFVVNAAKMGIALGAIGGALIGLGLTLNTVASSLGAVNLALKVLAAHPAIAAAGILAAVIARLAFAFDGARLNIRSVTEALAEMRRENDAVIAANLRMIEQLNALGSKEQLTNVERREAAKLIEALESRYGRLNVTMDASTGKLIGLAEALAEVNRQMRTQRIEHITTEIKMLRQEARKAAEDLRSVPLSTARGPQATERHRRQAEAALQHQMDAMSRIRDLQAELNDLRGGGAILKEDTAAVNLGATIAGEEGIDAAGRVGGELENWARRVHQLEIELIDNEHQRELARINERYDHEVERARGNARLIEEIEAARSLEVERLDRDRATRMAEEMTRAIEAARQRAEDIAAGNADQGFRNDELRLRLMETGVGLEAKLLDLEEQRALEDARRRGLNLDAVREEFDLRRQMIDVGQNARTGLDGAMARGLFNPLERLSLKYIDDGLMRDAFPPQSELTLAAKKTAENTKSILDLARNGGLVFG